MRKHSRPPFYKSLFYAFRGLYIAAKYERNMRIHLIGALTAVIAGLIAGLNRMEWLFLMLSITLVLFAELINTALETHVDIVVEEKRYKALVAKDISAGAVLITVFNALFVGALIFGPRLLSLLTSLF